jgi:hypothetical protein
MFIHFFEPLQDQVDIDINQWQTQKTEETQTEIPLILMPKTTRFTLGVRLQL